MKKSSELKSFYETEESKYISLEGSILDKISSDAFMKENNLSEEEWKKIIEFN